MVQILAKNSNISVNAGGPNVSLEIFNPLLNSYPCALATVYSIIVSYIPSYIKKTSLYKHCIKLQLMAGVQKAHQGANVGGDQIFQLKILDPTSNDVNVILIAF